MASKPRTVDEYLAELNDPQRSALEQLRRAIKAAAPRAAECISYGLPSYRLEARLLVSFGAAKKHCAFYAGAHPIAAHADELAAYDLGKGTIRFPAMNPLPAELVKKLVQTRIAQFANTGESARRASGSTKPCSTSAASAKERTRAA
jgi:uncharacterized protein YdhG (YjbR/CyaY superfamily)